MRWFISGPNSLGSRNLETETGALICRILGADKEDAHLIAAVPELLDILKLFKQAYEKWNDRIDGGEDDLHYAATQAEVILSKAEKGEAP